MNPGFLLLVALTAMLAGLLAAHWSPRVWLVATLTAAAGALGAAIWILATGATWNWQPDYFLAGEQIHLQLDALGALFLALLAVVGGAGSLFSSEYWSDRQHPVSASAARIWWNGLSLCMAWIFLSANGLLFLMAWELATLCAYFLMTVDRRKREVRQAGWLFLAASHLGTLCLFAFFSLLAVRTHSWELKPLQDHPELAPLFWLALVGFGLKAGLFPLHIWLPSAHANAPSHVSALLSGVMLKMGIYGLVRFSGWLPTPNAGGWTVAALGVVSAVLGVAFALGQHDLKRLLAYHSVENIGIILIGLGFAMIASAHEHPAWGRLALAGALLHVWNHGLFKALLFLGAGSVLHATGTRQMSRLGGLWRVMPWTAGLFTLGAMAIAGLPPLNGLVSEWLLFLGLFDAVPSHDFAACAAAAAAVLLGLTGALALACFVKVCGVVFLGVARTEPAAHAHECGWQMRVPMLMLGACCVAIGLAPALFWPAIANAMAAWQPLWQDPAPPAPLVTLGSLHIAIAVLATFAAVILWRRVKQNGWARAGTWDCGYAAPTPRMQYTAGSFAGIITGWFAWILQPHRHSHSPRDYFPAPASYEEHTPETVLEHVVEPAGRGVIWISRGMRRLQHGRLQAYILYLLAGLAALIALALMGGNQ
ncbi:MAG TPA: proton-conducting transporter membrane subunit [Candidatus Acidoferrales bacterium]|nr:proton-conducting transporter membrane subunit [Candidatus Acidoferrales bacterium]